MVPVAIFLGPLLAVALSPLRLVLAACELVKVVVALTLALIVPGPVLSVPLAPPVTLALFLIALCLTSAPSREDTHNMDHGRGCTAV